MNGFLWPLGSFDQNKLFVSFPSIPNVLRILKYFLFYALGETVSLKALDFQAIFGVI